MLSNISPVDVLDGVWWIGAVALGVSLVVTPIVRFVAYRARIVDRPDDLLKPHGRPIAYLGGVAICAGLLAGLVAYLSVMPHGSRHWSAIGPQLVGLELRAMLTNPAWNLLSVAVAGVLIMVIGLVDDVRDIRPKAKVAGQVVAALILVVGGVGHDIASIAFTPLGIPFPPFWLLVLISAPLCVVIVIASCNATNLLDGLDGLCGGVTGIVTLGFLAIGVFLATYQHFEDTADPLRVALCLAMAGAVLGFLPYNIPPASIFMGDAGSMLLGFFVATMMALFTREHHARFFLGACVVFALPILDTGLAVVRRIVAGRSIFAGDRSHLYDQLVDRGMSVKQVVVLFYILAILAAAIGVLASIYLRTRYAAVLYAVLLLMIWAAFYKLGMIRPGESGHESDCLSWREH